MFALSLAQLRAHTSRLLATGLAIIIAVGFVVATLVLDETSKATVYRAVAAQYQHAAAVITADSSQDGNATLGHRPTLVRQISRVPGVRAVAVDQSVYTQANLPGRTGYRYAELNSVAGDPSLQWQKLKSGRLPTAKDEVAIGQDSTSTNKAVKVGAAITLLIRPAGNNDTPAVARRATIVGIVDLMGAASADGAGSEHLFATPAQTQAWGATDPEAIRVAATPGTDPKTLASRIRTTLGRAGQVDLTVRTGTQEAAAATADLTGGAAGLTLVLLSFATVAVLVCMLVIANTFAVLLAQRTRELALLRCVGASSRQLRRGVLVESLVIGAVASAIGVAAGIAVVAGLSALVTSLDTQVPLAGVTVPGQAVAIGMALGIGITVLAAFLPALRATRVAPLAALRPQDPAPLRSRSGLLRRGFGVLLLIPGVLALGVGANQGDLMIALAGGVVSFIAVVLLAQWLVPPVVALAGRLTGPSGGVPGRLAAANALRNPQRTAATATALIIGVTLTATMVVGAASTRATATSGLDNAFPTDVVVSADSGSLPAGTDRSLSSVPNVHAALALPEATVKGPDGEDLDLIGIDPARAAAVVRSAAGAGVPEPGTISVPESTATAWAKYGKRIRLTDHSRSITVRIHPVSNDAPVSLTRTDLDRLAPQAQIGRIWLKLDDGLSTDQRRSALDSITSTASSLAPASYVQGAFEERDNFDRLINTLLLIVTGLLAVAVIIAVIGVGNTMALSVLERRQESGLLRALGLTRGQLRWMLLWEAVLIAGVASILGTALGIGYGALGTSAALSGRGGLHIAVPWLQLLLIVAVATGAGALASVLPSRRAARISPVAAIAV